MEAEEEAADSLLKKTADDFIGYIIRKYKSKKSVTENGFQKLWEEFSANHTNARNCFLCDVKAKLIENRMIKEKKSGKVQSIEIFAFHSIKDDFSFAINKPKVKVIEYHVCTVCYRGFNTRDGLYSHCMEQEHQAHINNMAESAREISGQLAYMGASNSIFSCPVFLCKFDTPDISKMIDHLITAPHYRLVPCRHHQDILDSAANDGIDGSIAEDYPCIICQVTYQTTKELEKHRSTEQHKSQEFKFGYQINRSSLIQERIRDITIEPNRPEHIDHDRIVYEVGKLSIRVNQPCASMKWIVDFSGNMSATLDDVISYSPGFSCRIDSSDHHGKQIVQVYVTASETGKKLASIIFKFHDGGSAFNIVREMEVIYIKAQSEKMYQDLAPTSPFKQRHFKSEEIDVNEGIEMVPGVRPERKFNNKLDIVHRLDTYDIPSGIWRALKMYSFQQSSRFINFLELGELTLSNYGTYWSNVLFVEEHQQRLEIQQFTMRDAVLERVPDSTLASLKVPGLAEKRPTVLIGDEFQAVKCGEPNIIYLGYAHYIRRTKVELGFHVKRLVLQLKPNWRFTIEFGYKRTPFRLSQRAVLWAGDLERGLEKILFPRVEDIVREDEMEKPDELVFYNKMIGTNSRQKQAVECIVMGTSLPAPYLIFGPPGTGKTVTVVEAIKQVYKANFNTKPKILVCAPQNAAADVLTERLLDRKFEANVFRMNSASRNVNDLSPLVQQVSNYRDEDAGAKSVYFPSVPELKRYDIVVCTLVAAGRLSSSDFDQHFSHIFIDEAGHATEPETMIAISGLLDPSIGQLVLAGDPKQLGAVIASPIAEEFHLERSLLERLMTTNSMYLRNYVTGYDKRVVTKLVKNFRSHPDILCIPNELFYDGELEYCANNIQRSTFCQWQGLPKLNFPVIFHGVQGQDLREEDNPSWFNREEVIQVVEYVKQLVRQDVGKQKITTGDIGIISPYRKQVQKIKDALRSDDRVSGRAPSLSDIRVGSVEVFQGEEKKIIIISTVRSTEKYILEHDVRSTLGFLSNPKRFNVAITRAKALLIVIGNPEILCQDDNWKRFIEFCHENGGYRGVPPPGVRSHQFNIPFGSQQNIPGSDTDTN